APAPLPPFAGGGSGGIVTASQLPQSSYVPVQTSHRGPEEGGDGGGHGVRSGLKALAFVVLGGLLASGLLLALRPEALRGVLPGDGDEARPADERGAPPTQSGAEAEASKANEAKADDAKADEAKAVASSGGTGATSAGTGGPIDAEASEDDGEVQLVADGAEDGAESVVEDEPRPTGPLTAEDLVVQAERALAANHWREPAEQSMALALANLALVDPGHEALARLRRAAADELLPLGDKALRRKQWTDASAAYRDLVAVWPDHVEARTRLLEALHNQGRVLAKKDDPAKTLAVADEILTMEPDDFKAMMLRAEALYDLGRYAESKQA